MVRMETERIPIDISKLNREDNNPILLLFFTKFDLFLAL